MKMVLATLLLCAPTPMLAGSGVAGHTYSRGVQRFVHSGKRPIDFRVRSTTARDRIRIYDVTYASALSGRVPAYVVIPDGKGPFAAVLFAHWAMEGSQTRNRTEFLDEAVALAHAGAICLLPDAPFARPGQKEDSNPLSAKSISMFFQQILDLRRGIEILTRRADVDKTRIGFVGHSYDANAGGVLAGVDKRLKTLVLMAGGLADIESMDTPEFRKEAGNATVDNYIRDYWWLDPAVYIPHAAPAAVFLQYGRKDPTLSEASAHHYFEMLSEPKALKFYDAGHALDSAARRDRIAWLVEHLGLGSIPTAEIDRIPDTR